MTKEIYAEEQSDKQSITSWRIPKSHDGIGYQQFNAEISRKRKTRKYMEIGVQNGLHLSHIEAELAVGIDPSFRINVNIASHKKSVRLYQTTSDDFFSTISIDGAKEIFDFIFLDGYHVFEFLLRDFYNSERYSTRGSPIVMHDCLPLNDAMTRRIESEAVMMGENTLFKGSWTGDVWKIIPILRKYRPELKIICVDCPPTGLVCVTNLDPDSTVLYDRYLDIVEEFKKVESGNKELQTLYESEVITKSVDIIKSNDHTLFFRI